MPAGRPTKYKPEYCEEIIKVVGEQGMPDIVFAGNIGVHQNVLDDWEESYPEFLCARKKANALRAALHMKEPMHPAKWIFLAKNWCGLHDQQQIKLTGSGPNGEVATINTAMSPQEAAALYREQLKGESK